MRLRSTAREVLADGIDRPLAMSATFYLIAAPVNSSVKPESLPGERGESVPTTPDKALRVELDEPGQANAPLHWDAVVNGQPLRYTDEPLASAWRRLVSGVLGALAPERLL